MVSSHVIEQVPCFTETVALGSAEEEDDRVSEMTGGFRRATSGGSEKSGPLTRSPGLQGNWMMESGSSMSRRGSRHLCKTRNGMVNEEMTRTPSLLLVDFREFQEAAVEHEKDCSANWRKELDDIEERAKLNRLQRKMKSTQLIERMAKITDARTVLLQGFNWESWRAGGGDFYNAVGRKEMGFTDLWLPPCSQSVAPQGYLPSQLFNLDGSKYGTQQALEDLLEKCHKNGIRCMADIVINHRCGDRQDEDPIWPPSFAGVADWGGWAVTLGDQYSDGSGMHGPGHSDGRFDAAPDIDHRHPKVQECISIWLRWLRLQVGFDGWRFDFVKGYGPEFSHPAWAVGELWTDMNYDLHGLCYNQDKHRQTLAFDFTTKGVLQEACRLTQFWRLRDKDGKPPGLIGWLPQYAVTFIDNHDTGSTQRHWPFPDDKVLIGYAYILTHPGVWSEPRKKIGSLMKARRDAAIPVDAPVNIQCADDTLYLAEIGNPPSLRVALGPRPAGQPDMTSLNASPEATPLGSPRRKKEGAVGLGPEMLTAETLNFGEKRVLQAPSELLVTYILY
eukprot:g10523.t1